MKDNIERILELVDSYSINIDDQIKNSIRKYDDIIETDDAIQLYVRRYDLIQLDLFLYAIIELGIDKRLDLYEEVSIIRREDLDDVFFNIGKTYVLQYRDCINFLKHKYHLYRSIFYSERCNSLNLFRKLLELGYINDIDLLKVLLQHMSNVEFRIELINYIRTHSNEHDDCDIEL